MPTPTPAITPSPTPSPVVSPTPTPTPTATVGTFAAVGLGNVAGVFWPDVAADGFKNDAGYWTDLSGQFGGGVVGFASPTPHPNFGSVAFAIEGLDTTTGFFTRLRAPAGATVVSPISTLIYDLGDVVAVRKALGLTTTKLLTIDLLTFDPTRRLADPDPEIAEAASQILAANARLLALHELIARNSVSDAWAPIARAIKSHPDTLFWDRTVLKAALLDNPDRPTIPQHIENALDIAQALLAQMPDRASSVAAARGHVLTASLYVASVLGQLYQSNQSEATALKAMVAGQVVQWIAEAKTTPAISLASSGFFAAPDYRYRGEGGSPLIQSPLANDAGLATRGPNDVLTLQEITVDSANASKLEVEITANGISVKPKVNGYKGFAYFDYRARLADKESTSRVVVFFWGI